MSTMHLVFLSTGSAVIGFAVAFFMTAHLFRDGLKRAFVRGYTQGRAEAGKPLSTAALNRLSASVQVRRRKKG